jgi:hypothetical protein
MGSWWIVAGSRHQRVRITWDGREFELSCEYSRFMGSSAAPQWQEVEICRIEGEGEKERVWAKAEELALKHLAQR